MIWGRRLAVWAVLIGLIAGPCVGGANAAASLDETGLSWSGLYVGGHAGYHSVETRGQFDWPEPGGPPDLSNIGDKGYSGGILAGYNWQRGATVVGIEADYTFGMSVVI